MDIGTAFPSDFLRAADLEGTEHTLTMRKIDMEKIGDDTKPVLYFDDADKGLVLNKTNANTIAKMFGQQTDDWMGKRIVIFPTQTDFRGDVVACIRVKILTPKSPAEVKQAASNEDDANKAFDSVPF